MPVQEWRLAVYSGQPRPARFGQRLGLEGGQGVEGPDFAAAVGADAHGDNLHLPKIRLYDKPGRIHGYLEKAVRWDRTVKQREVHTQMCCGPK